MQIANRMVWSLSLEKYERMLETYGSHLYPNYKTGFLKLDLNPQEIPSLDFLNTRLEESGWGTVGVNGYISSWDFFALLRKKQFPVARSMRSLQDIDHAPAPDFIHDVLGHVALLFDDDITKTMLSMASLAEHLSVTYLDSELDRSMHSIIAGNDNKEQYS